jgi:hypothetical protein
MIYPLYNGTIQLKFEEARHRYEVDGEPIISVTGVESPKPGLVFWAAKEAAEYVRRSLTPGVALDEIAIGELCEGARKAHREISGRAMSIGTLAHQACEKYAKTGVIERPVNEQAGRSFDTFVKWFKDHDVKVHGSEVKIYSKAFKYAGTCDLFCVVDGEECVVDIKTSSALYPEYAMQLAAYANARNEELGTTIYGPGWVVRLPKDGGEVETKRYTEADLVKAFRAFEGLLAYHKWAKRAA